MGSSVLQVVWSRINKFLWPPGSRCAPENAICRTMANRSSFRRDHRTATLFPSDVKSRISPSAYMNSDLEHAPHFFCALALPFPDLIPGSPIPTTLTEAPYQLFQLLTCPSSRADRAIGRTMYHCFLPASCISFPFAPPPHSLPAFFSKVLVMCRVGNPPPRLDTRLFPSLPLQEKLPFCSFSRLPPPMGKPAGQRVFSAIANPRI